MVVSFIYIAFVVVKLYIIVKLKLFICFLQWSTPFFTLKVAEIERTKCSPGLNLAIGLSEYCKIKGLYLLNFSGKIQLLFVLFGLFFAKKGAWSHVKGPESKSKIPYVTNTIPRHV